MAPIDKLLVIGQCMTTSLKNAVKVQFKTQELDKNLLMYFPRRRVLYAQDEKNICKTGDIVLIKQLPEQPTKEITHEVVKIVYPLGNITDPVTGKKVIGVDFEEILEQRYRSVGSGGYLKYKDSQENVKSEV